MLALAGCASAGDTAAASEAAPAESTAESAAAEDSTEAALPGEPHPLSAYSACAVSGSSVYTAVSHFSSSEDSLGNFDHSTVYKTDLTTGQTYEMYRTGSQLTSAPLIIDDTLYFICYDGGMLALPTTGGEARVLPFSYDDWMPVFTQVTTSTAGASAPRHSAVPAVCGLTWKTGRPRRGISRWRQCTFPMSSGTRCCSAALSRIIRCPTRTTTRCPRRFCRTPRWNTPWPTPRRARCGRPALPSPMTYRSRGALRSTPTLASAAVTSISAQTSATMSTLWFPSPCCASARTAPGPTLALPKRRITWITVRFCRAMRCAGS